MAEKQFLLKIFASIPRFFSHIYLITAVLVGWVFFYYTSFPQMITFLKVMTGLTGNPLVTTDLLVQFRSHALIYTAAILLATPIWPWMKIKTGTALRGMMAGKMLPGQIKVKEACIIGQSLWNAALVTASTALLVGATYNPFLYFRF